MGTTFGSLIADSLRAPSVSFKSSASKSTPKTVPSVPTGIPNTPKNNKPNPYMNCGRSGKTAYRKNRLNTSKLEVNRLSTLKSGESAFTQASRNGNIDYICSSEKNIKNAYNPALSGGRRTRKTRKARK
jgi:hypothetical protein